MATAEILEAEYLTCPICYDVYKCPKALPCLHTFCEKCLQSHIVEQNKTFGVKRKGYFLCPMCRCTVKPKYPSKPLDHWTEDITTNFFIDSLISTFMKGRKEQTTNSVPGEPSQRSTSLHKDDFYTGSSTESFPAPPEVRTNNRADDSVLQTPVITSLPRVDPSKTFTLMKTLNGIKKSSEARFSAVCVLKNTIVALDFSNQLVQMFYNWRAQLDVNVMVDTLKLPTKPHSMIAINNSMVMVSLPTHKKLYIISVEDSYFPQLLLERSVKTWKSYKCLKTIAQGKVLATATEPAAAYFRPKLALDVLDYEGNCLYSIKYAYNLRNISPISVTADTAGQIYILDQENKVHCLTQDGEEVFRYMPTVTMEDFMRLQCVKCRQGNIYFVDAFRILKLQNDCGFPTSYEILLSKEHSVYRPMDLDLGPDGTLYVAYWNGCVRVYDADASSSKLTKKSLETTV